MKGGIYTSERCQVCGARMVDNRRAVACPEHPEQKAGRIYVRFGTIFKRFKSYQAAERFWTGVRFKTDEGSFDARDYRRDNPLSFDTLISAWLEKKKEKVKPGSYRNLRNYAERAGTIMGGRNVKDITFAHLEDFFDSQTDIGDKTKANMRSALHDFWQWIVRRQVITRDQVPEFPEIDFVLGYRATIDKDTQGAILEKIRELSHAKHEVDLGELGHLVAGDHLAAHDPLPEVMQGRAHVCLCLVADVGLGVEKVLEVGEGDILDVAAPHYGPGPLGVVPQVSVGSGLNLFLFLLQPC
jgi:hypothetical protein